MKLARPETVEAKRSDTDTPEARTELLLSALAEGKGAVERHGAWDLSGLLADPDQLRPRLAEPHQVWWNVETGGLDLTGACMPSAVLSHAVLRHANCRGADLSGAIARSADLSHAVIEEAVLSGADCGGALFSHVKAGEANFAGAMLEDANFENATLRYANLRGALIDGTNFEQADLWGVVLDEADADESIFRNARLDEASLASGNFAAADFTGASLKKVKFDGAVLRAANFEGARLEGASLRDADLSRASLPRINLLSCDLAGARFAGAWLENTRLRMEQFGDGIGEEAAGEFEAARQAYIAIEQNFRSLGDSEGSSWAFRKRRIMGKHHAGRSARVAWNDKQARAAIVQASRWASDVFVEWLCDYGESLWRTVRAFFATILFFATIYGVTGALTRAVATGGPARSVTRNPVDLFVYSFMNMLSTSAPDIGIKPANEVVFLMSSLQGALGIVLIGLFGYVLGNRLHR